MRRLAVPLLVTLTACGGGSKEPQAAPSTTPATTSSAPLVTPEAREVRDAVAKTLAACPCEVAVRGSAGEGHQITLRGVYDPKTQTAELREVDGDKATGVVVRVVEGRTFMDPALKQWLELDFAGMPKKPVSVLAAMTLADPRIAFAAASNVSVATAANSGPVTMYDVEYDVASAAPALGTTADLLKRLVPDGSVYDKVWLRDGRVDRIAFSTPDDPTGDLSIRVMLTVVRTGVAAKAVAVPRPVVRKVDVATYAG